ncbi:MAG: hypothetical protein V3T70_08105 [Phycisphaerae bacterium]
MLRCHHYAMLAAVAMMMLSGCARDPWTDGRYWRQPVETRSERPVAIRSGRWGEYGAESGTYPGFTISGEWGESGGASAARFGRAAESGIWLDRAAEVGEVPAGRRYGRWNESGSEASVFGDTMTTGAYTEVSTETAVHTRTGQ